MLTFQTQFILDIYKIQCGHNDSRVQFINNRMENEITLIYEMKKNSKEDLFVSFKHIYLDVTGNTWFLPVHIHYTYEKNKNIVAF
jgi:hypothetical protein